MWFDSHCHLHLCAVEGPAEEVIDRARLVGVGAIVTVGIDVESSNRAVDIARGTRGVYASVGVHPNDATEWDDRAAAEIEAALAEDGVVAVGESGLDFYRDTTPRDKQEAAFRAHIRLAKQFDKALVIHTRASVGAALDLVEDEGPPQRLVWHCWSGNERDLGRALEMSSYISFAGNVTFKNAQDIRSLAALVPDDRLLLETDSPFLSPVPYRGRPNEPARVLHVGEALARVRATTAEAVARCTSDNGRRLFSLDG